MHNKRRILVIDDSAAIHKDFRRSLCPEQSDRVSELSLLEEALFGPSEPSEDPARPVFELDSAYQGQEGLAKVREAQAAGRPYALVFLDYRMPPGWNGAETLKRLREVAPTLPVVLCSAYSDYSWEELIQQVGSAEHLVELRKPFNVHELQKVALELSEPPAVSA